jgi:hypothetical protein
VRTQRDRAWIGVDIGKTHHWVCAVDESGQKLLSLKVLNRATGSIPPRAPLRITMPASLAHSTTAPVLTRKRRAVSCAVEEHRISHAPVVPRHSHNYLRVKVSRWLLETTTCSPTGSSGTRSTHG